MIVSAVIALALSTPTAAATSGASEHEFHNARIVSYDPMPSFGSGMMMVLRGVEVAGADGQTFKIFFIHQGAGSDHYPDIGTVCSFTTVSHRIANEYLGDGGPSGIPAQLIQSMNCGLELPPRR